MRIEETGESRQMKREVTIYVCDRCGCEYNGHQTGWYTVNDGEYAFIGVKAMFSNAGVGSKYDLCRDCTIKIVEQWLEKLKRGE